MQIPQSWGSDFNAQSFLINQILNTRNIATLVQIKAVTNAGGVSPVGFVDVLPLVNQLDGDGNAWPHGVVHNLPYFRLQGGANAVILDPQVGDIGMAVFADRDISSVKAKKGQANPSSARRSDFADGMYVGGFLNGTPVQYVQFTPTGINVVSPTAITIKAPAITLDGAVTATSTINAATSVTAPLVTGSTNVVFGSKSGIGHVHSGVQTGPGNTGAPV
jgi:hypothetical protein